MFFTYAADLPPGVGFALFSAPHLGALMAIALLCLVCACRFRAAQASARRHLTQALGLSIVLLDIVRTIVYHCMGCMNLYELPLHLCGMAVYLCAIHSLWKPDWLGQVLYALCLPGACAALLFPDWTIYPFFSFVSLHSFAAHGLIVLYIVVQTASGAIRPCLFAVWKPVLFLCAVVPPIAWFDSCFHANYMFLQLPSPGSPLVWLAQLVGGSRAGYLLLFAVVIFCVMVLMDAPFALAHRYRNSRSI